eukprot:1858226-Amphidinium_carterae.1
MYRLVQPDTDVQLQTEEKQKPCQAAGVCVCAACGKELLKMQKRLHLLIKLVFKNTKGRAELSEGRTVLCCTSLCSEPGMDLVVVEQIWLHLGLPYFSPWKCLWQRLQAMQSTAGEWDGATSQKRHFLKLHFHELVMSKRAIPSLEADVVCVLACRSDVGLEHFWPVKRAPYKRRAS